jgi:hypothetical protein
MRESKMSSIIWIAGLLAVIAGVILAFAGLLIAYHNNQPFPLATPIELDRHRHPGSGRHGSGRSPGKPGGAAAPEPASAAAAAGYG